MKQKTNYNKGHFAEKIALVWLMLKGWWPIAMNYSGGKGTGMGEVDLILVRAKTIIFVEVKYRPSLTQALEAITVTQQMRVARAAAQFLATHPQYRAYQARFDAVLLSPHRRPHHIPNAWSVL